MRTRSKLRSRFALLLAYAFMVTNGPAELPPSAYKERQANAPEALVIKVRSVSKRETKEENWKQTDFTVEAEVEKVGRSASKLKPGELIQIRYTQPGFDYHLTKPVEFQKLEGVLREIRT